MKRQIKIFRQIAAAVLLAVWLTALPLAASDGGNYLTAERLTAPLTAQLAAYTREALQAVMDGRTPVAPADLPLEVSQAVNGAAVAVLRDGQIVAQGHSLGGDNLLNNIRLAANRAVFSFRVDGLEKCTLALSLFDAGFLASVPAPLFKPDCGFQAYQLEVNGRKYFAGALKPLLQQWTWQQTMDSLLQEHLPKAGSRERLEILAAPDCRLRVFTAHTIIAPPQNSAPPMLLEPHPAIEATGDNVREGLKAAGQWWLRSQNPAGFYPDVFNSGTAEGDVQNNGFAAAVLGMLWRRTGNKDFQLRGLRVIDWLLMNYFLEAPGKDFGYLAAAGEGAEKTVDTGTNAVLLWAIDLLEAAKGNGEIGRHRAMLVKFLLSQRAKDGYIRPWFLPAASQKDAHFYQALALIALFNNNPREHAAAGLQSLEMLWHNFAPAAAHKKFPPNNLAPWLTLATLKGYETSRRQELAGLIFQLHRNMYDNFCNPKNKVISRLPAAAFDLGMCAFSVGQTVRLQKLLGAAAGDAAFAENLKILESSLMRELLALQVKSGPVAAILPAADKFRGAFLPRFGEFTVNLTDMVAATLALLNADF